MPYPLTYVELFAGAGGLSLGLETAGWQCVAHAEWDAFPRRVLKARWPDVPLFGDVSELDGTQFKGVTLLTGGSPCQDLSIAGKRAGMTDGTRSSLFHQQIRLWHECEAPFILWENVIGAFSSQNGRDFASVLSAIVGRAIPVPRDGWRRGGVASGPTGIAAWRVLDAQYLGVPQRRRRVFVLGTRDPRFDPAEILSLFEGLSGHLEASGEAREGVAADAQRGIDDASKSGGVPFVYEWHGFDGRAKLLDVARTLNIRNQEGREHHLVVAVDIYNQSVDANGVAHTIRTGGGDAVPHTISFDNRPHVSTDGVTETLTTEGTRNPMSVVMRQREGKPGGGKGPLLSAERKRTLGTGNDQVLFTRQRTDEYADKGVASTVSARDYKSATDIAVAGVPRRLTPMECERLMGWPDGWTDVPDEKGKPAADTARYKACGNGVASPVAAWIGFRLRAALEGLTPNHFEQ